MKNSGWAGLFLIAASTAGCETTVVGADVLQTTTSKSGSRASR